MVSFFLTFVPSEKPPNINSDTLPVLKKIFLLSFLLLPAFLIKAQPSANLSLGKIDGVILDSVDRQPIEYATIALSLQNENTIINGTTSDPTGRFILTKIPKGIYRI